MPRCHTPDQPPTPFQGPELPAASHGGRSGPICPAGETEARRGEGFAQDHTARRPRLHAPGLHPFHAASRRDRGHGVGGRRRRAPRGQGRGQGPTAGRMPPPPRAPACPAGRGRSRTRPGALRRGASRPRPQSREHRARWVQNQASGSQLLAERGPRGGPDTGPRVRGHAVLGAGLWLLADGAGAVAGPQSPRCPVVEAVAEGKVAQGQQRPRRPPEAQTPRRSGVPAAAVARSTERAWGFAGP